MRAGRGERLCVVMTSPANPEHWSRLCKVIGREELINDPRFSTPRDRVKNDTAQDAIITEWTRTRSKHEAMEQVGGAGIPAGAVLDTMELQNEPTFENRGIMQVMQHPYTSRSRCRLGRCAWMASRLE